MGEYKFNLQIDNSDFDSNVWEVFRGAYGNIKEDLIALLEADHNIPEEEKRIYMDKEPESDYRIAFEDIYAQLIHQCSFYSALYLVMPYLVQEYEYWRKKNDLQGQILYLANIGIFLSMDIPYNHEYFKIEEIPQNILDHYQKSIEWIRERAKEFLAENLDKWKQFHHFKLSEAETEVLGTGLLGLLGDREAAFLLLLNSWGSCITFCENCGYLDEDIEFEPNIFDKEAVKQLHLKVKPADSVIGKWDFKNFEDSYLWLSNVLYLLEDKKDVKKLSYYYGTYTCPKCGTVKGPIMKLMMLGLTEG